MLAVSSSFWISTLICATSSICLTVSSSLARVRCFKFSTISRTWCMDSWLMAWISCTCSWAFSIWPNAKNWSARSALTLSMAKVCPRLSCRSRPIRWRSFSASKRLIWAFCLAWSAFNSSIISIRTILKVMIAINKETIRTKSQSFSLISLLNNKAPKRISCDKKAVQRKGERKLCTLKR